MWRGAVRMHPTRPVHCRYPKIVVDVIEDHAGVVEGEEVPVDLTAPNPNGIEFDNLYLVSYPPPRACTPEHPTPALFACRT